MKEIRQLSKTTLILLLIIALLCAVVFAVLYTTRIVDFQASIKTYGDIELFEDSACTIPLTSFDFGEYEPNATSNELRAKPFYIKNIGNIAVTVSWQLTASTIPFEVVLSGAGTEYLYKYDEGLNEKWAFGIYDTATTMLNPSDSPEPEYITLQPSEVLGDGNYPRFILQLYAMVDGMWLADTFTIEASVFADSV